MVEEAQLQVAGKGPMRRKVGNKKGGKGRKERNMPQGKRERVKVDQKMKKLFRKRARDYNSDDDEEDDDAVAHPAQFARQAKAPRKNYNEIENVKSFEDEVEEDDEEEAIEGRQGAGAENEFSDGEDGEIQPGVTRFTEGCRAFRMAFKNVIKKAVSEDSIGPVLSAHKKLVAEKLAEEETERKVKGEAKKEKHLAGEKGHVKPANYLDAHEKFLIGVATKGVVKLFNAVNKAQNAQKGLNPLRSKDAKTLNKRRKEAFFSELGKTRSKAKAQTSSGDVEGDGPAWAPLRDNYMLTSSKLKDWDKMPDGNAEDDGERMSEASSSEDDD